MTIGRVVVASAEKLVSNKTRNTKAPLELTPNAVKRLKYLLNRAPKDQTIDGFRLGVKTRGCSGQSYTLDYNNSINSKRFDEVISDEETGVKLVVDSKALLFVIGTKMDYEETDIGSEFVFYNPNAKSICGCGESFSVNEIDNLKE